MLRVVFLGPPGSGKGSQASGVVENYGVSHISTGDLLRAAVKAETDIGKQAAELMQEGSLVPDALVIQLIAEFLDDNDVSKGFLLDGFPRSLTQAEKLDEMLAERECPLDFVVHLEIEPESVVKRLSGRRTCSSCGRIYNIYFGPPKVEDRCDDCDNGELTMRADDNEESIRHRLSVYDNQTKPLLKYYEDQELLRTVDASGTVAQVQADIKAVIETELN